MSLSVVGRPLSVPVRMSSSVTAMKYQKLHRLEKELLPGERFHLTREMERNVKECLFVAELLVMYFVQMTLLKFQHIEIIEPNRQAKY